MIEIHPAVKPYSNDENPEVEKKIYWGVFEHMSKSYNQRGGTLVLSPLNIASRAKRNCIQPP